MVHQGDQSASGRQRPCFLGQRPEGKSVDHDRMLGCERRDAAVRGTARRGRRTWKALADVEHLHAPAQRPQLRDDAPVIGVAAGRGGEIARHHERSRLHHNGASYQALAEGDSRTVMRMAASSRPSRPSLPAFATSAS